MGSLLDIDSSAFSDAFAWRSIAVGHGLVDHPLFTLDAIAELADRLPPDSVRRERGNLPLVNRDGYVDVGEGAPSATIRDVERNGFRISLRDIQQDRRVRRSDQRVPRRGRADPEGARGRHAAPHRLSLHHRTGLQHADALRPRAQLPAAGPGREARQRRGVRGRLDPPARARSLLRRARSATSRPWRRSPRTSASTRASGSTCPSFVPHWVTTEAGISISFSIPFYTEFSERAESVNRINRRLRKMHMSPRGPGRSEPVDRVKAASFDLWGKLSEARRKLPA